MILDGIQLIRPLFQLIFLHSGATKNTEIEIPLAKEVGPNNWVLTGSLRIALAAWVDFCPGRIRLRLF